MLCQKEHENRPPPDTADCHRRRPAPLTDIVNQTAHRHTVAQPTAAQPAGVRPHRGKHTAVRQAPSTVVTISTSQPAAVIIMTSVQIRRHTTAHTNVASTGEEPQEGKHTAAHPVSFNAVTNSHATQPTAAINTPRIVAQSRVECSESSAAVTTSTPDTGLTAALTSIRSRVDCSGLSATVTASAPDTGFTATLTPPRPRVDCSGLSAAVTASAPDTGLTATLTSIRSRR